MLVLGDYFWFDDFYKFNKKPSFLNGEREFFLEKNVRKVYGFDAGAQAP